MFTYSKLAQAGIAAVSYLAAVSAESRLAGSAEIAESREISRQLIAKILTVLSRAGIVTGTPGPSGGYRLARPAADITLFDVVRVFENPDDRVMCPFGPNWCGHGPHCPLHDTLLEMHQKAIERLSLETFDGIGRERTMEGGAKIDPSGELDGVAFDDAVMRPAPLAGRVPIIVGGDSPAAMRRAARCCPSARARCKPLETHMNGLQLTGATRVIAIFGDPIAQVKSPAGVTADLQASGHNAVCVPAHVAPADLAAWTAGVSLSKNVDGIIVTVPHKFAYFELCASTSERGAFLKSINTLRRNPDGTWHGDMFDGLGYVKALALKGCSLQGKKALLVGAGAVWYLVR